MKHNDIFQVEKIQKGLASFISTHSFIENAVLPAGSITVAAHLQSWPFPGTTHFLGEGIEKSWPEIRLMVVNASCMTYGVVYYMQYANYISKRVDAIHVSEFIRCI